MPDTETALSELLNKIVETGQTGYVFSPADKLMANTGIPKARHRHRTRFKRAGGSSRAANVLKESPQQTASVYFVLLTGDYTAEGIRGIIDSDMRRTPTLCDAVVLLKKSGSGWKVSEIIAHTDGPTMNRLKELFPRVRSGQQTVLSKTPNLEALSRVTLLNTEFLDEILDEIDQRLVIFAGPPGTGKTWAARQIGEHITSGDKYRVGLVQFHPAMSYESFVQGLQPIADEEGRIIFKVVDGAIVDFANLARNSDDPYVFIIDEINRANVPKVLGELIYLLEYRGSEHALTLQYQVASDDPFSLPENLRFLATMNTADRSLRGIDSAIRRRFSVFEFTPSPDALNAFYSEPENSCDVDDLVAGFEKLNQRLEGEIDRHHRIGHTFFMHEHLTGKRLRSTWRRQIAPLLEEYFFDSPDQATTYVFGEFWPSVTTD